MAALSYFMLSRTEYLCRIYKEWRFLQWILAARPLGTECCIFILTGCMAHIRRAKCLLDTWRKKKYKKKWRDVKYALGGILGDICHCRHLHYQQWLGWHQEVNQSEDWVKLPNSFASHISPFFSHDVDGTSSGGTILTSRLKLGV